MALLHFIFAARIQTMHAGLPPRLMPGRNAFVAIVALATFVSSNARALNPASCADDPSVRPQWVSFEASAGALVGAPDGNSYPILAAEAAYYFGLETIRLVPSPGEPAPCEVDLDSASHFLRAGLGYATWPSELNASQVDLSWHHIVSHSLRLSAGVAADYRSFGESAWTLPVGTLLRLNYSDWISVSTRLAVPVAHAEGLDPSVSAMFLLSIEPRLYCEHISRERCGPTWFFEQLLF